MNYRQLISKAFILYLTGVPGLIRLGFVLFMEKNISHESLGKLVSDISIVQLASFFTAIGWSGVVMGLVNKSNKEQDYKKIFYSSFATVIAVGLIVILLGMYGFVYSIFDCLLFLMAWTIYQLTKHYSLYDKSYNKITIGETAVIGGLIALIYLGFEPLISLSIAYLAFVAVNLPSSLLKIDICFCDKNQINKSWDIATSNFALGLGVYSLLIISGYVLSKEYAGLIGVGVSFVMILHLIPRSISNHYLPEISKNIKENPIQAVGIHIKQKQLSAIGSFAGLTIAVLMILMASVFDLMDLLYLDGAVYILLLLGVNSILTIIGLPITDMFNSIGGTKYTAKYTYIYGLIVLVSAVVFITVASDYIDLILLLLAYALAGFFRLWLLGIKLNHLIAENINAVR